MLKFCFTFIYPFVSVFAISLQYLRSFSRHYSIRTSSVSEMYNSKKLGMVRERSSLTLSTCNDDSPSHSIVGSTLCVSARGIFHICSHIFRSISTTASSHANHSNNSHASCNSHGDCSNLRTATTNLESTNGYFVKMSFNFCYYILGREK